ncbi:hypothetical protein [Spiroplasma endosymbiont of Crioceris asparagi]|uniref:hypothetical protein n=1 Tax=Spiroplasma endosymbiont of Crioceris asparagi TaxID=3066286 RepID=UPI0030D40B1F
MINFNLIKRVFKTSKSIYLSILAVSLFLMAVSFFSTGKLAGENPTAQSYLETYNKIYFGTFGLIFTSALAALLILINLTKEIDNCSLSIYLVSDKSRTNVLLNKYFSIFAMLFAYAILQIIVLVIGFNVIPEKYRSWESDTKEINLVFTYFLGTIFLMTLNFLFAALFNNKNIVIFSIAFISTVSTLMRIVYSISGSKDLEFFTYISTYVFSNDDLINKNNWSSLIPYAVWIFVVPPLIYGSVVGFNKRNLYL